MNTEETLDAIKRLSPALSSKDLVPAFSMLFFQDGEALAFNDIIAIATPCEMAFEGGIPGQPLLKLLAEVGDKFEVVEKEETVQLKSGRTRVEFATMPSSALVFEFPEGDPPAIEWSPKLRRAFESVAVSMGTDPHFMSRIGVTVTFRKGQVSMYSTNNSAITAAVALVDVPKLLWKETIVLPPLFVDRLLDMENHSKLDDLSVTDEFVIANFSDGTRLWSKTGVEVDLQAYEKAISSLENESDKPTEKVPVALHSALTRAGIVVGDATTDFLYLEPGNNRLVLKGTSPGSKFSETLPFKTSAGSPTVVSPRVLQECLLGAETIKITEACVFLAGKGFDRFVSPVAG